jgi:hypothetical protein
MNLFYKVILLSCIALPFTILSANAAARQQTEQSYDPYMRLQLQRDGNSSNYENILIRFENGASLDYVVGEDAEYFRGFGNVNLNCISQDGIPLAINTIPFPQKTAEEIQLDAEAKSSGSYSFDMTTMANIPPLFDVWLIDKYQKDSVNMRKNNLYHFSISKTDTASFGTNRFVLVIRQNPAFAYQLLSFTATEVQGQRQVTLAWQTLNEGNYTGFSIERSIDNGQNYTILDSLQGSGMGHYTFTDINPAGRNIYRLIQKDIDGVITYSQTVGINYDDNPRISVRVYPNPVNTTINLAISAQASDMAEYEIRFTNSSGVLVKDVTSANAQWKGNTDDLQPGLYFIQVRDTKNDKLIGKSKFVKL